MNVQVFTDPFGRLLWASPALPGAVHDVRAAREHGIIDALEEGRHRLLGGQGLPRRPRHHQGSLPRPVEDAVRRTAGREPVLGQDPSPGRASHGHPQNLATPPQAEVLNHPHHSPRPSHPHPPSGQLRRRMKRPHCRGTDVSRAHETPRQPRVSPRRRAHSIPHLPPKLPGR